MAGATRNGFDKRPGDINRKGRPKKEYCLTDILREQGEIEDIQTPDGKKISRKEAVAQKLWSMALAGDSGILKYLYDRIDGKPNQTIENTIQGETNMASIAAAFQKRQKEEEAEAEVKG